MFEIQRTESSIPLRRLLRVIGILVGYGVLFVAFDTHATFFEIAPGVSLWYPSAGLNLALVLIFGVRYTPAILVALLTSGLWISDPAIPIEHLLLPNLAIAVGNGAVGWGLRRQLRGRTLAAPGSIVRLVAAMAVLAGWNSGLASVSYLITGLEGYSVGTMPTTIFKWWVGDWAGLLTLTPPLLVGAVVLGVREAPESWSRGLDERRFGLSSPGLIELGAQLGAVVLTLYGTFQWFGGPSPLYLCFLPVLWMALRQGLPRATLGVLLLNLGAVALLSGGTDTGSIFGLQMFILALALTGLVVGALVSERRQAVTALRRVLRGSEVDPSEQDSEFALDAEMHQVADRVQSQQEQMAADADLLQRQNRRRDQLFGLIAHDLQGNIGTAGGLAEVVETEAETLSRDMIATFGNRLRQSIGRAQTLLDGLLEWAHLYAEDELEESEGEAVAAIVDPVLTHLKPDAAEKEIEIESEVEPGLVVRGHATLLQAVVRNLLSNALKFTEKGGRVAVEATGGGNTVTLCVRDNGVGIPEGEVDSLFSSKERTSQEGTAGEKGAGLGLVLCREIVEQYDGRIWAESTRGEGTTVCFTLPAPDGEPVAEEASPVDADGA